MRDISEFEVILFDLDDTLIDDSLGTRLALEEACRLIENECGALTENVVEHTKDIAKRLWRASPHYTTLLELGISSSEALYSVLTVEDKHCAGLSLWAEQFQHHVWRDSLSSFSMPSDRSIGKLSGEYKKRRIESVAPFQSTIATLTTLSATHKLAIVTNGPADLQRAKIAQAGLIDYFNSIIISGERGVGKPDREIFRQALTELETLPEKTVMVGDSYERDIVGAQNSGIYAIQICATECDDDVTIRHISELLSER